MTRIPTAALTLLLSSLAGCSSLVGDLPEESPSLADMEEPAALHEEPEDEAERRDLALGGFTGVYVRDSRRKLSALDDVPEGVQVQRVVENSPGDVAGIVDGDLIFEIETAAGDLVPIRWPSEWRKAEQEAPPGSTLLVYLDRAGVEEEAEILVVPRVRPAGRRAAERYREEQRVGVVLRTATEVEARRAGLGAGGGAVVVGLSRESPWRQAGLRFGDVLTSISGKPVAHPQVVLDSIRDAGPSESLDVVFQRDGEQQTVAAPVTRREQTLREISVPPLFSYEADRGETELSVLLGLVRQKTTRAAWEWRILWLLRFSGGDADRLEEVQW